MGLVLAAILVLAPLLIAPGVSFYFDVTPKIVIILLGAAVVLPWSAMSGELALLLRFRAGRWFAALLAAQFCSLLISTVLSQDTGLSVGGTNWRRLGLLVHAGILGIAAAAAAHLAAHPQRRRSGCRVVAVTGLIAAGFGIAQYLGVDPVLPRSGYHVGEGAATIVRPPGTLGYANYFGSYLLVVTFAGVALTCLEPHRMWRAIGVAAVTASGAAIVLSGTRAAMLGLASGTVLLILWLRPRIRLRWAVPALAGVACVSALFYYSPAGDRLRNRTRWFIEDPTGGARLWLWRDSLQMASSRWALGYGPETFGAAFPRFQSGELARAYPDFYHESPHNVFLDALSGQGVVGLAALLALCALGLLGARRARGAEPVLAAAVAAALLALLVSLQFTGFMSVTMLHFYLLLAVAVTASHAPVGPAERKRRALALAVPAVVPLVWFAVKLAATDRALAAAARAMDEAGFGRSIAAYESAWRWRPPGEFADLWFSRRMVGAVRDAPAAADRSQAMQRAFRAALSATETAADRQNAWYSLAAFHAARNDYPATESSLRAAIRDAPRWFKPHWTLARVLLLSGRTAEAEREAALAVELSGGKHAEVAQTLDDVRARLATAPDPRQP